MTSCEEYQMNVNCLNETFKCQHSSDVNSAKADVTVTSIANDAISSSLPIGEQVYTLYKEGNAEAILSLLSAGDTDEKIKIEEEESDIVSWDPLLLWVRPRICCLQFIANHVKESGLSSIASVGCGTGLLEWLIYAISGLSIMGYEVNGDWWKSRYAPPTFISLHYVDPEDNPPIVPCTHALMCCYFNNAEVFRQYVDAYDGPVLIIIGSVQKGKHTDPRPYDYRDVHPWTLIGTHKINDTDVIACYIRDQWKVDVANKLRCVQRKYRG